MQLSNPNIPIIKGPAQRMQELKASVSGTVKRHDAITIAIQQNSIKAFKGVFKHEQLADILSRKLKSDEGYILDHNKYKWLFGQFPSELDVADLQHRLAVKSLSLSPLYSKTEQGVVALFIVIHRQQSLAIEYADDLRCLITGQQKTQNVHADFIKAALKVSENLGAKALENKGELYRQNVLEALQLLTGDEVYLVSMSYCMAYRIDPKQLDELLISQGFKVSILKHDKPNVETLEAYKFYENIIGLAVSRTDTGIQLVHANLNVLFRVCEAAEAGLPKAATMDMIATNHV